MIDYLLNIIILFNRIESKYYIALFNNQGSCLIEAKNKPNDIFENSNIILAVEKNFIEVFEFSQIRDNDKIINNLIKKTEIIIMKPDSIPSYQLNPLFMGFKPKINKLSYDSPKPKK